MSNQRSNAAETVPPARSTGQDGDGCPLPFYLLPNELAGLETFVDRLFDRFGQDLPRIVLSGLKARGDSDDESDLDLLVIVGQRQASC